MSTLAARSHCFTLALASVCAGTLFSGHAGLVILDTFGPGDSYDTGAAWTISTAASIGADQSVATPFTPGVSQSLERLTLATRWFTGSDSMTIQVLEDSGGLPNGPVLESFSGPMLNGVQSFNSVINPLLTAGTTYWVAVLPGGSDTFGGWFFNDQGLDGAVAFESGGGWVGDYQPLPALRVELVPELQSSAWVAALGLLGFGASRRARPQDSR